jgi:hypothetical protein
MPQSWLPMQSLKVVTKKISAARIPWIMQLHNFSWTYSTSKVYERYAIWEGDKPSFWENGKHDKTWLLLKCSQLFVWVINVCIRIHKNFFKEMLESFCCLCNAKQKGNLRLNPPCSLFLWKDIKIIASLRHHCLHYQMDSMAPVLLHEIPSTFKLKMMD